MRISEASNNLDLHCDDSVRGGPMYVQSDRAEIRGDDEDFRKRKLIPTFRPWLAVLS